MRRHDEGPTLTVLTLELLDADAADVSSLPTVLTQLAEALSEASWREQRRVCVEVRTRKVSAYKGAAALPDVEAIVAAVRGVVQSYTLECGPEAPPVNLLLTTADQEEDRSSSWRYLGAEHGGLARGATFDLRSGA